MKEPWKLMTVHFVFSAITLTFVIFVFIHVNMAIEDLQGLIPKIANAIELVPNIQNSMETASERVLYIENNTKSFLPMIDHIENSTTSFTPLLKSLTDSVETVENNMDEKVEKMAASVEETNKLLLKICEIIGCGEILE